MFHARIASQRPCDQANVGRRASEAPINVNKVGRAVEHYGSGASEGNGTIAAFFSDSQFLGSVIAGANPATYPWGNFYPPNLDAVEFINLWGRNYRLSLWSPYIRTATDGTDVGANIDEINAAAGTQY